jgi:hypothetical protein
MKNQKYQIITMQDLSNVITPDNYANIMIDLVDNLTKITQLKQKHKNEHGTYPTVGFPSFDFIDDCNGGIKSMQVVGIEDKLIFDEFLQEINSDSEIQDKTK